MYHKLDKYEQDIEDNFEKQVNVKNLFDLKLFQDSAKVHLKTKYPIIPVPEINLS